MTITYKGYGATHVREVFTVYFYNIDVTYGGFATIDDATDFGIAKGFEFAIMNDRGEVIA